MNERKSTDQAYFRSKLKRPNSLPADDGRIRTGGSCSQMQEYVLHQYARNSNEGPMRPEELQERKRGR